jgi:hypothetical protein
MGRIWPADQIGLMRRTGLRTCGFYYTTKIWIRYQMLVSDADSSDVDDWGRNRPSSPHTFSNGP